MSENVRIRMGGERHGQESRSLLGDDQNGKVKFKQWQPITIGVALVVGLAVLATTVLVINYFNSSHRVQDSAHLDAKIYGTPDKLDQTKIATDPAHRLDVIRDLLKKVPLIDGHNDLAYLIRQKVDTEISRVDLRSDLTQIWRNSHTDIPRLRQGGLGGQFWSVYVGCEAQYKDAVLNALVQTDLVKSMILRYPDVFQLVTTAAGITEAHGKGKIASLLGVEGGHMIGEQLGVLRQLYDLGVRYMTLTHNCNTPWADSCYTFFKNTPDHNGLTDWGRLVVKEMNRLGMVVDISHVSADVMRDVLDITNAPIMFSHSSAYSICPHQRNVPDDVLKKTKENGGVVMVNYNPHFVNCTLENRALNDPRTASLEQVADHIEYIRDVAGVNHIGIGSDYDGIPGVPVGLEDVSTYPYLLSELLRRGWAVEDLAKLAGLNVIRVLSQVEQVRDTMSDLLPMDTPIDPSTIPDRSCISEGGFAPLQNTYSDE